MYVFICNWEVLIRAVVDRLSELSDRRGGGDLHLKLAFWARLALIIRSFINGKCCWLVYIVTERRGVKIGKIGVGCNTVRFKFVEGTWNRLKDWRKKIDFKETKNLKQHTMNLEYKLIELVL